MEQNTPDIASPAREHDRHERQQRLRVLPHNPVTQKLMSVGQRRETAEAQLQQRLRGASPHAHK